MALEQSSKLNKNRTYIYTNECVLCGHTEEYREIANRLKLLGKEVYVKQVPLFIGWQYEATEIGLPMPFVYDCDTGRYDTCPNLDKLEENDLKDWLHVGSSN